MKETKNIDKIILNFGKRSGFDARSRQPDMALRIVVRRQEKNTGNDESILALKLMGSHPKSETEGTSGPTKWTLVQQKQFIRFKIEQFK